VPELDRRGVADKIERLREAVLCMQKCNPV
jgi:hypothetical protein